MENFFSQEESSDFTTILTRATFETINQDLFEKIIYNIDQI